MCNRTTDEPFLEYLPTYYDGPSNIIIPLNSSKLSKDELIDKIKGTLYGMELFNSFWKFSLSKQLDTCQ
jgi:hypothetical protein